MKITNDNNETLKAGCVVIDSSAVLLVTNKDQSIWAFPKGHAEAGETMEQVALRETFEETGYQVTITERLDDLSYHNQQTGEQIRVAMFLAGVIKHVEKVNDEISYWKPLDEAAELIYPNLRPYIMEQQKRTGE